METKKSIYEWMAEDGLSSFFESQVVLKLTQEGKLAEPVSEETSTTANDSTELRVSGDLEAVESIKTTKDYDCTEAEFEAIKSAVMKSCAVEVTPRQRAWITETINEGLRAVKADILAELKG